MVAVGSYKWRWQLALTAGDCSVIACGDCNGRSPSTLGGCCLNSGLVQAIELVEGCEFVYSKLEIETKFHAGVVELEGLPSSTMLLLVKDKKCNKIETVEGQTRRMAKGNNGRTVKG